LRVFGPKLYRTQEAIYDVYYGEYIAAMLDQDESFRDPAPRPELPAPIRPGTSTASTIHLLSDVEWKKFLGDLATWRASPDLERSDALCRRYWAKKSPALPAIPTRPPLSEDVAPVRGGVLRNVCHYAVAMSIIINTHLSFFLQIGKALSAWSAASPPSSSVLASFDLLRVLSDRSAIVFAARRNALDGTAVSPGLAYSDSTAKLHDALLAARRVHPLEYGPYCEDSDHLEHSLMHGNIADSIVSTRAIAQLVRASYTTLSTVARDLPAFPRGLLSFAERDDNIPEELDIPVSAAANSDRPVTPDESGIFRVNWSGFVSERTAASVSLATNAAMTSARRVTSAARLSSWVFRTVDREHYFAVTRICEGLFLLDNDLELRVVKSKSMNLLFAIPVLVGLISAAEISAADPTYESVVVRQLVDSAVARDGLPSSGVAAPEAVFCAAAGATPDNAGGAIVTGTTEVSVIESDFPGTQLAVLAAAADTVSAAVVTGDRDPPSLASDVLFASASDADVAVASLRTAGTTSLLPGPSFARQRLYDRIATVEFKVCVSYAINTVCWVC